jgi:transcription initiation factor TFIID subunit TAF12
MEVLLAGLDESEVEALSTGPLRNLSISHGSFSQAHQHALEQQQQQQQQQINGQQQQQQQHMAPVAEGQVEPFISGLQDTQLQETQQQQQVAAAADLRPELPNIFTSSSNSSATPAAAAAVDAAVDNAEDAVIEELVEEMLLHVCCDNMPSKIELGDSPTRSTSMNRKMAFEGAGPSRLGASSVSTPVVETKAGVAAAVAVAPDATAAVEQAAKQQQQQQDRGAAVADAHVVRSFMEVHCSQLTPYGLASLAESLKEHQLAVFFR